MSETIMRTSIDGNIISGEIKGYKVSGLVYSDGTIVLSLPVKQEVTEDILELYTFPKSIKDVRVFNEKIDILTNISEFDVIEGEAALEAFIDILIKHNIDSNIDYVEERVEKKEII